MSETGKSIAKVSRAYGNILVLVFILTLICLALMVGLGIAIPNPTEAQQTMLDSVSKGFFGCLGALVGVLGGKVA